MRQYIRLGLPAAVFVSIFLTVATALQHPDKPLRAGQREVDERQYPIVDLSAQEPLDEEKIKKRRAKGKRYNKSTTVVNPVLVNVVENHHWPRDFPALPIAQSAIIVLGQAKEAKAYLSSDETGVYSEFVVQVDEVFKNSTPEPLRPGDTFAAEREGGRVRYKSGHVSQYAITGLGMPRVGSMYLLFLSKTESNCQIITGYELRAGFVAPLDSSGVVNFDRYRGWSETTFLDEVRAAVGIRSGAH